MKHIRHRISHWLGWNLGQVESWRDGETVMVGFRCSDCGEMQHVAKAADAIFLSVKEGKRAA